MSDAVCAGDEGNVIEDWREAVTEYWLDAVTVLLLLLLRLVVFPDEMVGTTVVVGERAKEREGVSRGELLLVSDGRAVLGESRESADRGALLRRRMARGLWTDAAPGACIGI